MGLHISTELFALPPLTTSDGRPTGAIKGVTNMLMNLKESEGSPIIVVFDAKGKTLGMIFIKNINKIDHQCQMNYGLSFNQ